MVKWVLYTGPPPQIPPLAASILIKAQFPAKLWLYLRLLSRAL